jgi:hypothetical protein
MLLIRANVRLLVVCFVSVLLLVLLLLVMVRRRGDHERSVGNSLFIAN